MQITSTTPRNDITIKGLIFSAPAPFAAGHVLSETEASVLNQTFAENLRNNFAKKVEDAKAKDEKGEAKLDHGMLQLEFDDYSAKYEFGVRQVGSTRIVIDPVEKEALKLAKERVIAALKKQGIKVKDAGADHINSLAESALEKFPILRERAKIIVDARKSAGLDSLELDV